ncbi:hypothetical protein QAD02_013460 [Eretmocerus hayati]|uniref:Uncharacterized protein n=1 Tax=Eretmocerus hayati TaxID=131215 RepID=A0ACC2P3J2_9HYME|nr:hypothetical protein QAD02_013460 [Eretmocerus hayati]
MATYYIAQAVVPKAEKVHWENPLIIVFRKYVQPGEDGRMRAEYPSPPFTEDLNSLNEDFVVKYPGTEPPSDWHRYECVIKSFAGSYMDAQRMMVRLFQKLQAPAERAKRKPNSIRKEKSTPVKKTPKGRPPKKTKTNVDHPKNIQPITEYVSEKFQQDDNANLNILK